MSNSDTSSQNEAAKKLRIVLTGRAPVKIDPAAWPVIATADDKVFDNQYEVQANRITKWALFVRQHERGCALVYAIYRHESNWQNSPTYDIRGGRKISPGEDLAEAILAVAEWMVGAVEDARAEDARAFRRLGHECVGSLPPQDCECEEGAEGTI